MQLTLPMLTYYQGPRLLAQADVALIQTYRESVWVCWEQRTRRTLTRRTLAEEVGLYAPHVTDYLSLEADRRELPARYIPAFERACGNRAITQWLARQAQLTILEQYIERAAA